MATLTIAGTAADDTIVITASGPDSGSYSINGGPAVAFSGVSQVVVTGEAGNDTLTIVNPDGALFAPTNGISYDGGGNPADALEILGGAANDLTYTAGATHDAGTLTYTGDAGTQTIAFAGRRRRRAHVHRFWPRRDLHQRGSHPLAGELQRRRLARRHHLHERRNGRSDRRHIPLTMAGRFL
jgi:hypothetical protein